MVLHVIPEPQVPPLNRRMALLSELVRSLYWRGDSTASKAATRRQRCHSRLFTIRCSIPIFSEQFNRKRHLLPALCLPPTRWCGFPTCNFFLCLVPRTPFHSGSKLELTDEKRRAKSTLLESTAPHLTSQPTPQTPKRDLWAKSF